MSLDKYWEPQRFEKDIYQRWVASGAFVADGSSEKCPFVISMPPPNATGTLHSGHAVMLAIEDLMSRYRRMRGDEVLWLPGTDHAAIATESVVIKNFQAQGMSDPRHELGREGLLAEIRSFVEKSQDRIRTQIRAMGSSCDWSRERYTMDPQLNRCVNAVFARMFRDGLIYRGPRIVNWDPFLQTAVSDDEIYHEDRPAKFYTLRYGPVLVGTSRPETKLGDTAIAVHPDDPRYQELIGQTFEVPWPKGPTIRVKVVAGAGIDPEFGTGALGVTPAHSHIDFEIATQNDLPLVQVIGEDGRMTEAAGPFYAGKTVEECRTAFVAELDAAGLLVEVKNYTQKISLCYRSKKPIEPLPKLQWFINVNEPAVAWGGRKLSIKQVLREVVESGKIRLLPEYQEKIYFHWIDNLRDWCISRQIWWGHRVPVYYRGTEDLYVGHRPPEGEGWVQDEDTLDTWFSSALWTWSTLIDPKLAENPKLDLTQLLAGSQDFQRFHPTSVMETGYDILFFWVARMILMTTYATGQVPFETVYLHGLVLDRNGEKMSKSNPETSIDPLDVIEAHGADVMRLALLVGNAPGKDFKLGEERLTGCQRLITKIWNASKLVDASIERIVGEGHRGKPQALPAELEHPVNRFMVARPDELVRSTTARLDAYAFGDAAEQVRQSFWAEFCDFYLEAIKVAPLSTLPETAAVLRHALSTYLKLFHPFIPFLTEHLWNELLGEKDLIRAAWPEAPTEERYGADAESIEAVLRLVTALRALRLEQGLDPGTVVHVEVEPLAHQATLTACETIIARMVRAERLSFVATSADAAGNATTVDPAFRASLSLGQADTEAQKKRLAKQLEDAKKRLVGLERQLANEAFMAKASPAAVETTKKTAEEVRAIIASIEGELGGWGG